MRCSVAKVGVMSRTRGAGLGAKPGTIRGHSSAQVSGSSASQSLYMCSPPVKTSSTSPGRASGWMGASTFSESVKLNWASRPIGEPSSHAGQGASVGRYGAPPIFVTVGSSGSPTLQMHTSVGTARPRPAMPILARACSNLAMSRGP